MKNNMRAYIWGSIFLMLLMLCNKNTYVNVQVYKFKGDKPEKDHPKKDKLENKE